MQVVGLVVEAALEAAGGLQAVEAVLHVTRVAGGDGGQSGDTERRFSSLTRGNMYQWHNDKEQ